MGLSAFYARNDAEVDDLSSDQLERFSLWACYRVVDPQKAGFEIWPTFRTPHVTIALTGDLDECLVALVGVAHEVRVNPYHESDDTPESDLVAATQVDLIVDLNTMDDTGLPWAFLDEAPDPARIRPGRYVLVGSGFTRAIALVVDITDGIVHLRPLRGSVSTNAHLLDDPNRLAC